MIPVNNLNLFGKQFRLETFVLFVSLSIIFLFVAAVLFSPVIYDTDHFGDTIFILEAAWRVFHGFTPAVDFGHFYGGVASSFIAIAFTMFGPTVKAIDYSLILQFSFLTAGCFALHWKRISKTSFFLLLVTIATMIFTRHPLEVAESITRVVSTHSFIYNRLGLALVTIVIFFVAFPVSERKKEIIGGLICGVLLTLTALTKPTISILIPATLIALFFQRRFVSLIGCIFAITATLMLLDGVNIIVSAYEYAIASIGERADATVLSLLRKAVQLPLAHPLELTITISLITLLIIEKFREVWNSLIATLIVLGSGFAMAATMGGGGSLGQLALPLLISAVLVCFELSRQYKSNLQQPSAMLAVLIVFSFALPHLANTVAATLESVLNKESVLLKDGPLKNYLSVVEKKTTTSEKPSQYEMLAEGIQTLKEIKNISELGIIADSGIAFSFALSAPPVLDFPLWARPHSPEFISNERISGAADIVMIARRADGRSKVGEVIMSKLKNDFFLCKQTENWDMFAGSDKHIDGCSFTALVP